MHNSPGSAVLSKMKTIFNDRNTINTPPKRSDAQPLVEREKQFECLLVEILRSFKRDFPLRFFAYCTSSMKITI